MTYHYEDGLPLCDKPGCYVITNTINGKVYVGSATSIYGRLRDHRNRLRKGKHPNLHLQAAWDKYGEDAFKFEVIKTCKVEKLLKLEQKWIDGLGAADRATGYNICPKAGNRLGVAHRADSRAKMSSSKKGKPGLRTGATLSQKTKDKIGEGNKGKKRSLEVRAKMSAAQKRRAEREKQEGKSYDNLKANHWSKGPNAKAIAERIATAHTGRKRPPEVGAKISATKIAQNAVKYLKEQ